MFPEKSFDAPKMHYIIGDLRYETENGRDGKVVEWISHVAPIVKLSGSENLYILDPSIRQAPVTKPEYHNIFRGQITRYETCNSNPNYLKPDCLNKVTVDTTDEIKRAKRVEQEHIDFYLNM